MYASEENHILKIWNRYLEGDEEAFSSLFDMLYPNLFRYALQLSANEEWNKECIQLLFVEMWQVKSRFRKAVKPENYLMKVLRRKLQQRSNSFYRLDQSYNYEPKTEFAPQEAGIIRHQQNDLGRKAVTDALNCLTNHQREALFLRFYEGLGYDEIAAVMELKKTKYARTLIYRSLKEIRSKFPKLKIFLENSF
jgi:RNA polymerase sigma factor (sigma-70 family)